MKPLRWEHGALILLDQRRLPAEEVYLTCRTAAAVARAIATLAVRGAPAIGVAAAYGTVLAAQASERVPTPAELHAATRGLYDSRPTAVNLHWAIERQWKVYAAAHAADPSTAVARLLAEAQAIEREDIALNDAIARHGAALFTAPVTILTHCNAGALATAGVGTALGVVRELHSRKLLRQVYMDETRPLLQGSRLTATEMLSEGIPCMLLCDNMAAAAMHGKEIDAVVVGADRIAANGDTANKIGTYGLAILAAYHRIPFYVAAPSSTFDFTLPTGESIVIEERAADEVRKIGAVYTAPAAVPVWNPAFDVTPANLIAGIITETGVLLPPFAESIAAFQRKVES
ncbi:MAG: S-methyl-5-thioribose-1-phosphate isomerase [Veillonellaceae bacterium]|nr:S-methyl-5-thioribose-1-phosphate isomerase [Veillonellaceae bacterium]